MESINNFKQTITMKNQQNTFITMLLILLATFSLHAQNYKAPKIDASGKVMNEKGHHIGNISAEGVITDANGQKIASIDPDGFLIDAASGKKLGKGEKNGNFIPYFKETPDKGWTIDAPLNGTCLVKDEKGNVKAIVHENYKQFGACAAHCLSNHMDHHKIMEQAKMKEDKSATSYTCSMHPDVTSDKPGKCSKCGMELMAVKDK
jgi:hypothetical protein